MTDQRGLVYGVPLYDLLEKEQGTIPLIVEKCLSVVERRGLAEVGIYRISGENKVINAMKEAFDKKGAAMIDLENGSFSDCHNVTGALKLWLRLLPDTVIPHAFYQSFIDAASVTDYNEKMYQLRNLVWRLPQPHFLLLRRLMEHLFTVSDHEQENSMQPHALAIVFAPSIMRPAPGDAQFGVQMQNLGKATSAIKLLIIQAHWIFRDDTEEQENEEDMQANLVEDSTS
ncbi:RhoGAP-domain-containing protein [Atractiella rhizophila]|nr:RhoGAP-domain-containing protein [Atractiella rhizophila]